MAYVTGTLILAHAGVTSPTAADTAWAATVAAAIEATIAHRLTGYTINPDTDEANILTRAALQDAAAAYAERDAPHGVLTMGPDGQVTRLGRDIVRALEPVFMRIAGPGIG